jgi:hypothetical protein
VSFDAHKNFALSTVATAPSPATSGTSLTVATGDGAKFPTPPFNATIWPTGSQPTSANAEIVRVTALATDTLTITRAQESTSARAILAGDQIAATITAKTITDIEVAASDLPGNVISFGADPAGVADSTAAFTACAAAGNSIYVPSGTYLIAGTVEIAGKVLHGDGIGQSILKKANANVAMLTVTNGDKTQINDIAIHNTVTATSGASLVITANDGADASTHTIAIHNLRIDGPWTGIDISNSVCVQATGLWIFNYVNAAAYVHDGTPLVEFHTGQFESFPLGSTGVGTGLLLANMVEGITMTNMEIIGGAYAIKTSAVTWQRGSCPAFCFFEQCFFDSIGVGGAANQGGVMLDNTIGFKFTNCWFAAYGASTGSGAWLDHCYDTSFTSCIFAESAEHGAHLTANATVTRFRDCTFEVNGIQANNTYNGLDIASGTINFAVEGCRFDAQPSVFPTTTNKQAWGVFIAAGSSDNYVVINNTFNGNVSGAIFDGGSGTNKSVITGLGSSTWKTLFKPYGMRAVNGDGTSLIIPSVDGFGMASAGVAADNVADFYDLRASNLPSVNLRMKVLVAVNGVAPACTITFTLRTLTFSGNTSKVTVTAGSPVASISTSSPAAGSVTTVTSSTFAVPADGYYTICYQCAPAPTSGTHVTIVPYLEAQGI